MTETFAAYKWKYLTPKPFSDIWLLSDGEFLTGLYFDCCLLSTKLHHSCKEKAIPVFKDTVSWLDIYFEGKNPGFIPKYKVNNATPFRREVIDCMLGIHYGETVTYGQIAENIANKHGISKMSAQAVGQAVGWNPLCIIVPCHRVIGTNGMLTGYGGGINNKMLLLKREGHDIAGTTKETWKIVESK